MKVFVLWWALDKIGKRALVDDFLVLLPLGGVQPNALNAVHTGSHNHDIQPRDDIHPLYICVDVGDHTHRELVHQLPKLLCGVHEHCSGNLSIFQFSVVLYSTTSAAIEELAATI